MSQKPEPNSKTGESVKCSATDCWQAFKRLQSEYPLVQCITNYVSMDFMANTLLAIGASPAMAHGEQLLAVLLHKLAESLRVDFFSGKETNASLRKLRDDFLLRKN